MIRHEGLIFAQNWLANQLSSRNTSPASDLLESIESATLIVRGRKQRVFMANRTAVHCPFQWRHWQRRL